jgi:hypothetical protein
MPNICEICDSNEFENLDGFYYCIVCGTKSLVDIFRIPEKIAIFGFGHFSFEQQSKQDIELNDEEFIGGTVRIDETFKASKQSKKDILDEKSMLLKT